MTSFIDVNNNNNTNNNQMPKSIFTCSSTRQTSSGHFSAAPRGNSQVDNDQLLWLAQQKQSMSVHRSRLHDAFVQRCEREAAMTEEQRQTAIKILCAEAARYHVAEAKKIAKVNVLCDDTPAAPMSLVAYERSWWLNCASQVVSFLSTTTSAVMTADNNNTTTTTNVVAPSQQASENISSLGIWYVGQGIALSSRQYSVLALSHHILTPNNLVAADSLCDAAHQQQQQAEDSIGISNGYCYTPVYKSVVLVGICQFAYSNFIQNARAQAQINVLQSFQQ